MHMLARLRSLQKRCSYRFRPQGPPESTKWPFLVAALKACQLFIYTFSKHGAKYLLLKKRYGCLCKVIFGCAAAIWCWAGSEQWVYHTTQSHFIHCWLDKYDCSLNLSQLPFYTLVNFDPMLEKHAECCGLDMKLYSFPVKEKKMLSNSAHDQSAFMYVCLIAQVHSNKLKGGSASPTKLRMEESNSSFTPSFHHCSLCSPLLEKNLDIKD